jgi:hypothetical protein
MYGQPSMRGEAASGSPGLVVRFLKPAGSFIAQFAEMCAAMCAGGLAFSFLFFGAAGLVGYPDFVQRFPPIAILVLGINWALAMGAWMAFRRHPWRHNIEMSSTSIIVAVLYVIGYWLGIVHVKTTLGWFSQFATQCGPSCALMAAYMLFRHEHYTARAAHHAQAILPDE